MNVFEALAISCSVPFRYKASGPEMRAVLLSGNVPDILWPHVERIFTELPMEMIARGVFAFSDSEQFGVLNNLVSLADVIGGSERIDKWING